MVRSPLFRRLALALGLSSAFAAAALLALAGGDGSGPSFASEGGTSAAGWTPAPLLALLLVASLSGLVLLVSLQPRRG